MRIKNIKFLKSETKPENSYNKPEIAFVGRSNVGKSSLINYLSNTKIAKSSSSPGRTRLINYFSVNNDEFILVDLPGYGFSASSKEIKSSWGTIIEDYLKNSKNLACVLVLLDIRRKPNEDDLIMLNYLNFYNIPYTIVATKCDKLSKAEVGRQKQLIATETKQGIGNIYLVSTLKRTGEEELMNRINQFLNKGEE